MDRMESERSHNCLTINSSMVKNPRQELGICTCIEEMTDFVLVEFS